MDRYEPGSADCPIDGNAVSRDEGPSSWPMHPDALKCAIPPSVESLDPISAAPVYTRHLLRGCARPAKSRERVTH